MRFELLGPLRVTGDDGTEVPVSRARQRGLLAVLLLHANQPVSASRLAEAQCDGETGRSGSALRTHIWQLRRDPSLALCLHTVPGGYLLRVEPGELDLDRFRECAENGRRALQAGDHRAAVDQLTLASALWRDPALADLPRTPAMNPAVGRLTDERRIVGEHLAAARLALGDHRELLGELRERVQVDPLAERSWEQLALALYRCGRQAEALDAIVQARTVLADQYGIDPGAGLRELHMRILAADPALDLAPTTAVRPRSGPCELPPDLPDFTGRTGELATLTALLEARSDTSGVPRIAVITGAPGTGKTALAVHAAHALRRSFPDGQLYADLGGTRQRPASAGQLLVHLLLSLGVRAERIPETTSARSGLLRSLTADRSILTVLDDASHAEQVLPLLPGTGTCAVIITSRSRLPGLPVRTGLRLGPMSHGDAMSLLSHSAGTERVCSSTAAARVAAACGRMPLALRIAGERLAARPAWPVAELVELLHEDNRRLDELAVGGLSVRAAIEPSYRALPDRAQRALRLLTLAPSSGVPDWAVESLLGEADARDTAALLVDSSLLTATRPDSAGQLRYRLPPLHADYAREQIASTERTQRRAALVRLVSAYLTLARRIVAGLPLDPHGWFEAEWGTMAALASRADSEGLHDIAADLVTVQSDYSCLAAETSGVVREVVFK